jgi:cell volume regulation protein A
MKRLRHKNDRRTRAAGLVPKLAEVPGANLKISIGWKVESAASVEVAKHVLLVFGIILAVGTAVGVLAQKLRVPDVVVFLLVGLLLGPGAAGVLEVKADSALNQLILIFGACYILFDGGASLRLKVLKNVWLTIVILATAGVLITTAITGIAASYLLDIPLIVALLLAATIASTDPATLVPVFRQIRIRDKVAQTVMSESAFNDATGAIVTFAILGIAMGTEELSVPAALVDLLKQSGFGFVVGVSLGWLAAFLIAHEKFGFLQEYAPVVSLMAVIGAYLGADGLQASGFMAVFVFGIVIGNKDAFGFAMTGGEQKNVHFHPAWHPGGFRADRQVPGRRHRRRRRVHARGKTGDRLPLRFA